MKNTRSTRKTPAKAADEEHGEADVKNKVKTLAPSSSNPPMLFVLPQGPSPDARIVTLPSPATSAPGRYYFCPEKGIYEFTKIAAPKKAPRSWLLAPARTEDEINGFDKSRVDTTQEQSSVAEADSDAHITDVSSGYAIQDADLFLATPLDPIFVLLPALIPKAEDTKQLFLSIEDHLDALAENSKHLRHLIRSDRLRSTFERRANVVCDSVVMGEEKMYRLSTDKLLAELVRKAKAMTANGLPASMEEHFVQEALRAPTFNVHREESSLTSATSRPQGESEESITPAAADSQVSTTSTTSTAPSLNTQSSTISVLTEATSVSTTTEPSAPSAPPEISNLLRLRTAFSFILSSYIPATLRSTLLPLLSSPSSPVGFTPLDAHLEQIALQKREQQALRSVSDNISRKRPGYNDEEAEEARAEKKRRKDDDDAKKKAVSRGLKQLAKADTSGMKKMSSFFTKMPAKKKA